MGKNSDALVAFAAGLLGGYTNSSEKRYEREREDRREEREVELHTLNKQRLTLLNEMDQLRKQGLVREEEYQALRDKLFPPADRIAMERENGEWILRTNKAQAGKAEFDLEQAPIQAGYEKERHAAAMAQARSATAYNEVLRSNAIDQNRRAENQEARAQDTWKLEMQQGQLELNQKAAAPMAKTLFEAADAAALVAPALSNKLNGFATELISGRPISPKLITDSLSALNTPVYTRPDGSPVDEGDLLQITLGNDKGYLKTTAFGAASARIQSSAALDRESKAFQNLLGLAYLEKGAVDALAMTPNIQPEQVSQALQNFDATLEKLHEASQGGALSPAQNTALTSLSAGSPVGQMEAMRKQQAKAAGLSTTGGPLGMAQAKWGEEKDDRPRGFWNALFRGADFSNPKEVEWVDFLNETYYQDNPITPGDLRGSFASFSARTGWTPEQFLADPDGFRKAMESQRNWEVGVEAGSVVASEILGPVVGKAIGKTPVGKFASKAAEKTIGKVTKPLGNFVDDLLFGKGARDIVDDPTAKAILKLFPPTSPEDVADPTSYVLRKMGEMSGSQYHVDPAGVLKKVAKPTFTHSGSTPPTTRFRGGIPDYSSITPEPEAWSPIGSPPTQRFRGGQQTYNSFATNNYGVPALVPGQGAQTVFPMGDTGKSMGAYSEMADSWRAGLKSRNPTMFLPEELRNILKDPQRALMDDVMTGMSQGFDPSTDFLPTELRDVLTSPNRALMDDLMVELSQTGGTNLDELIIRKLTPRTKPQWPNILYNRP